MNKQALVFYLLILFFLQKETSSSAQCSVNEPYSCVDNNTALARMNAFHFKKNILNSNGILANDFTFSQLKQLTKALSSFASNTAYDGIRVYFALSDSVNVPTGFKTNSLYLIFIPTISAKTIDENKDTISVDDTSHAYITSEGGYFKQINFAQDTYGRAWINRYLSQVVPLIEKAYQNIGINIPLQETHSLWYSKRAMFFQSTDGFGPDLLTYLTSNNIAKASIHLAAWTFDVNNPNELPYAFKLSLVFEFDSASANSSNPQYFTFGINDLKNTISEAYLKARQKQKINLKTLLLKLQEAYTNTGNPCPSKKCPN
jgi:hypothetical protein